MHGALALGLVCALVGGCGQAMESQKAAPPGSSVGGSEADYQRFNDAPGNVGSTTIQQPVFENDGADSTRTLSQPRLSVSTDSPHSSAEDAAGSRLIAQAPDAKPPTADANVPAIAEGPAAQKPANEGNPAAAAAARKPSRRIIYVATLELVVSDFAAAEQAIPELVKKFDGYVSESGVSQRSGAQRGGRWVVRVPVDGYESFLAALGDLGVPENLQQNAQDVTQEFIDVEARMANQKRLEDRILKLLEKNDGGIKDVIEVERELARVRSEIETMEGRLRYLRNQTALTTVTINVREQQNYTPPQAPTFAGKIGRTWSESLRALGLFGQGLVLLAVALAPWFAIAAPFAGGSYWYWRRSRRPIDLRLP